MKLVKIITALLVTFFLIDNSYSQEVLTWTHFRGNKLDAWAGQGDYPLYWNDSSNIVWKSEIPGKGWSSPVVFGDQLWCTSATSDGKEMFAVCLDIINGKEIFKISLFKPDTIYRIHAVNSYATPTPCIEERFVYTHFGRYGTACISTITGEIVWKRNDLQCEHVQGPGSSPVIYKDKLIIHMEGTDTRYIYALDKRTGDIIWRAERPEDYYDKLKPIGKKAYITPLIITVNGRDLMISNGSAACVAYDLETGEMIWWIPGGEDSTISMPVYYNGIVYFYTSFFTRPDGEKYCELLAVDPVGKGDITGTNIIWKMESPILQLLTPVVYKGLLYTVDTRSRLMCLDAMTGKILWSEQLNGKFNSSPVIAIDRLYFSSTRGDTFVYRTGDEKEKLSENSLDGEIWATPAFINGNIYLRTGKYLCKIAQVSR